MVAGRPAGRGLGALSPLVSRPMESGPALRVCLLEELPEGQSRGFDPLHSGRDTLLVIRRGRTVHAWLDSCPHLDGEPLPWRKDAYLNAARDRIVCSAHGALFDIESGLCTLGPCVGLYLTRVAVTVRDSGEVMADATALTKPSRRHPPGSPPP